ncbi:MAG: DUF4412 domain-containing protein [Desulfomonilia bacterium]
MKWNSLMRMMILCAVCVGILPCLLHADMYLKYKNHTDAFEIMGQQQPAKDSVRETWVAKDSVRTDEAGQTTIMRLDKKLVYFVDHTSKVYSESPLELEKMANQAIDEDDDMDAEEKEQAKQFLQGMMSSMKLEISVKETGEKKKIGTWNCTKYLQTTTMAGTTSNSDVWATKDIKVDYELLNRMYAAGMMMMPGMRESMNDVIEEMNKIKGVTVYTSSTSDVMKTKVKTTQELIEYADKKAPPGFFEPPKGYKKQSM